MLECTYAYSRNFPSSMPFSNFSRVVNQYSLPFCTQAAHVKEQTVRRCPCRLTAPARTWLYRKRTQVLKHAWIDRSSADSQLTSSPSRGARVVCEQEKP